MVRDAAGPLRIIGGGTRDYGRVIAGEVLSVAGLSGITLYEPGALTLVAQAGTPLAVVQKALAKSTGESTIGAVVAANISGPRRVQAGAARDYLLGVRFVDGSGTVVKNGGRVMKNVTGLDLAKLMAGAHGTLGVLTEVAFKVLPEVEATATLTLHGLDDTRAIAALAAGLGSPFEVTGAAHDPESQQTRLRIEGFAGSVAYRAGRLVDVLAPFGVADIGTTDWAQIRDVTDFATRPGDVWRLSVKPSDAPGIVGRLNMPARYDWGGGLVWVLAPEGTDLRAIIGPFAGHATLIRASHTTRAAIQPFHPEPAANATLTKGLRTKFDPRGILNPGLMD
jgi:glycolate oxidase FAD binding subunit